MPTLKDWDALTPLTSSKSEKWYDRRGAVKSFLWLRALDVLDEDSLCPIDNITKGHRVDQATAFRFAAKSFFEFVPDGHWYSFFFKLEVKYPQFARILEESAGVIEGDKTETSLRYLRYIGFRKMREINLKSLLAAEVLVSSEQEKLSEQEIFRYPLSVELAKTHGHFLLCLAFIWRRSDIVVTLLDDQNIRDLVIDYLFVFLDQIESNQQLEVFLDITGSGWLMIFKGQREEKSFSSFAEFLTHLLRLQSNCVKEGQQHFEILNRLMFYLPRFGNAEDLTNCKVNIVAALGGFDSEIQFNIIRQWIVSYSQIVPLSKQDCLSEIFFSLFPIEGEFKFYFIKFNFWNKEAVNLFESQFVENNSEYIEKLWKLIRNDTPSPKSERAEISKSERAEIYIYQTLASVNGVGLFAAEKIITNFSNNQYECDILQLSIITWILGDHESFHRYRNLDFELESQGAKFFDLWIQRVCESRTCQSDLWEEFASSLDGNDQLEAFDYYYDPFLLLSILFGVERDYDLSNSFLLKAINRAHMSVEFHSIWTSRILDYLKSDSPIVSKVFRGVYDSRNV